MRSFIIVCMYLKVVIPKYHNRINMNIKLALNATLGLGRFAIGSPKSSKGTDIYLNTRVASLLGPSGLASPVYDIKFLFDTEI